MLFGVAAVLITSATLNPVAEAFSVPQSTSLTQCLSPTQSAGVAPVVIENASFRSSIALGPATSPSDFGAGPGAGFLSPSIFANLSGTALLQQLSLLPASELGSVLDANPNIVTSLLATPPEPRVVSSWWGSLDTDGQRALMSSAPRLVGNLDGVPSALRNIANRVWVEQTIGGLKSSIASGTGRAVNVESDREIHLLAQLDGALGSSASVPQRSLLSVDPSGQGTAAVVIGDLSTADYVTYMIPGMFFTVDGQITDWTDAAARLYDEQVSWLNLIKSTDASAKTKTVAVVAWMGYQTPDLTDIGTLDLAYKGRDAFAHVVQGMQAERAGNEPYTTIIAHSYGSTAALMALTEYDFQVDALALVGSPGSEAQSVKQLHVRDGNVFVGEAAWDPIPNSSYYGSDPGAPSYGAKRMSVAGGIDQITQDVLAASTGHNEYFSAGTESIRNMALIGIGHGELVTDGSKQDSLRTLALLK